MLGARASTRNQLIVNQKHLRRTPVAVLAWLAWVSIKTREMQGARQQPERRPLKSIEKPAENRSESEYSQTTDGDSDKTSRS